MARGRDPNLFGFARVEGRADLASFDGEAFMTDAGGLLLGAMNRAIRLVGRLASCFRDARSPMLVGQCCSNFPHLYGVRRWSAPYTL